MISTVLERGDGWISLNWFHGRADQMYWQVEIQCSLQIPETFLLANALALV